MQIIVVGAGIAGLSAALSLSLAGHKVILVESASKLAEVGAGLQLTPSATKWLWKWGLGPDITRAAVLPGSFNVRSAETGETLGKADFADFEEKYGGPYLVIHRADLHHILHEHAVKAGTEVRLNSRVAEYDFEGGSLKLQNGKEMHANLIVAVDGINSMARRQFLYPSGQVTGLQRTGFAAFRTMADVSKVEANPATASFVASHNCNCVAGNGGSVMTYMVKGNSKLNLVLGHLDNVDTTDWTQEEFRAEIRHVFKDFNDATKALIDAAFSDSNQTITNWPISEVTPLQKWHSKSGKFVMMGDAAHAMTFFLSLGVSMAVEDAAALVECLSLHQKTEGKSSLGQTMEVFSAARIPRVTIIKDASLHAGDLLHMASGLDRDIRDEALKTQGASVADQAEFDDKGRHFATTKLSYGIVDQKIRDYFYGYDLRREIHTVWDRIVC